MVDVFAQKKYGIERSQVRRTHKEQKCARQQDADAYAEDARDETQKIMDKYMLEGEKKSAESA